MSKLATKLYIHISPCECKFNAIWMAFRWRADSGPILHAYWVNMHLEHNHSITYFANMLCFDSVPNAN